MERTELLSYNINVELKAFASVPDKDLIVQTFCDVLLGADPTMVVHAVHIQNNGTVRLWIDTDAIPSGSSRIIHRIFVKRELFADVCQHTDQKREEKETRTQDAPSARASFGGGLGSSPSGPVQSNSI